MSKKILVGRGFSQYNVLCQATDEICQGFINAGYQTEVIDFHLPDAYEQFQKCLHNPDNYSFYFSMQALYWDEEKTTTYQLQNIKRIGWIVDDPIYHDERLSGSTGKNATALIVRDSHANIIKHDYPHIDHVETLYHGGFICSDIIPYCKRKINVFFPGTYTPLTDAEQRIDEIDGIYHQVALAIKPRITGRNLSHSWRDELKAYFSSLQVEVSEKEFHALEYIMSPLDFYQRTFMRTYIIESLLKNNIDVSVVGSGWDKYNGPGKEHLHILSHTGIDINETVRLMGNSKIVLNNTNITDGLHERILSAMLAQSVCVTNGYTLLDNLFQDEQELITFSLDNLETLPNTIKHLLANPQKCEMIAKRGYQSALQSHTWIHRGEQIINWISRQTPFSY